MKKNTAFTLTELAFSIAIMSIISVAVSTLLTAAYQAQMTHRTAAMVESISMNFTEQFRRDSRLATAVQINGSFSDNILPGAQQLTGAGNRVDFFYERNPDRSVVGNLRVMYRVDNATGTLERVANYDPERRIQIPAQLIVYVGQQANGQPDINRLVGRCINLQPGNNNNGQNGNQEANNCFRYDTSIIYSNANPQIPGQTLQSALTRVTVNGLQISPDPDDPAPQVFPVDTFGRPVYNIRQTSFELGGAKVFR